MTIQDKVLLVFKGILLYTTIIVCLFSVMGIDNIYDKGYFFTDIALCATLIYVCYKNISKEELSKLSLNKYFGVSDEDNEW